MQQHATTKGRELEDRRFDGTRHRGLDEAYENLKVQVDAEKKLKMESKLRRMVIEGDKEIATKKDIETEVAMVSRLSPHRF